MIGPGQIFRQAAGAQTAAFAGEEVLLDPQGRMLRGLNPTGARVWALLDGRRSVLEIARALARETAIDEARALADVSAFLQRLLDSQLLTETR